jgi:hypothetical protein
MERAARKKRAWKAGIGFLVVALAVIAIWHVWPRERLLMEVAHPVVKVDVRKDVCWISAHQLLIVTTEQEADYARARNGYHASAHWLGSADILDTATNTKKHLAGLTNLLKQTTKLPFNASYTFETSPDGEWLLWEAYVAGGHGLPYPRVAHLDGSHYRGWNQSRVRDKFFLDSSHLVQLMDDEPVMTVCDLLEPTKDKQYNTPEQAKAILTQYASREPVLVTVPSPQDEATLVPAEIYTYRTEDRIRLLLSSSDEKQPAPLPVHTVNVRLPEGAMLRYSNVSPRQQSVFYHLRRAHTNPVLVWLHRFLPKLHLQSTSTEDVWVSRADGGGLREIGYISASVDDYGGPDDLLEEIRWLSDGRQLSFVYQGTLYVVPAVPGDD